MCVGRKTVLDLIFIVILLIYEGFIEDGTLEFGDRL